CPPRPAARPAPSSSTPAAARCNTWPPGTSTRPGSSAAASLPPASRPFGRLVTQVMTTEPYACARRVFWVADNGSSHRGHAAAHPLQGAWPSLRLVHLPVHASWLNQVEVYFSVIQRKILTPSDVGSLAEAEAALLAFQDYYQQIATPFEWKLTKPDLDLLLKRL